ncbi:protein zwilch [Chironomus tepperi]|uniref:protein zwilch n=1 Tax=Chironomus tepperi TaxID=113505 RepID=UPI00391F3461
MSNLTNVYAYLRDKFQDVDMLFGKSPSFVKTLTGIDSQKIIFIYKEDAVRLKALTNYLSPTSETNNKSDTNFNFSGSCGSPLKDDNSITELINTSIASKIFNKNPWRDTEEGYGSIDINYAQTILNDISNQDFSKDSKGWVFILCGSDHSQNLQNSMFLLSFNVSKNKFTRGFAKYYGVVNYESRSIRSYLQQHNAIIPRTKAEVHIESTFEMTTDVSLKFLNTMNSENCSLSHISDSSQVILSQKVEIGKSHVLCEQLWSQIQLLYMIKNDIVNVKNMSCDGTLLEPAYNYGSMKYEDLQKKCNTILSDVTLMNDTADEIIDTSLEAIIKKVFNRPLIEITDQIWELIKFASSYSDLRKILTFIFQISSRSSIVNIPMNNNRLAELIREISQQRLAIPHLSSTEPLELLLEIGIEKVMKDYEYIFSESKICLLSDMNIGETNIQTQIESNMNVRKSLAPSALEMNQNRKTLLHGTGSLDSNDDLDGIRNSRFSEKESDKSISKMAQIHLAIEHLLMMQNNLNMNNDYKHIARKILENPMVSFEDLQVQKYDKLQIPINDKKVIHLVDNLMPNSQKITFKSENKFKLVENVFYFNVEQIVPLLVQKESEGEVADKKGDVFHFINYASITSKY